MMKPCVKYQKRLWLDAYGELGPEARRELAQHLSACPGCRHERQTLRELIGRAAKAHSVPVLTSGESARLTGNIMRALASKERRRRRMFWPGAGWARMAAAVCLILAAAGAFQAWQKGGAPLRTAAGPGIEEQILVQDLEVIQNLELLEDFDDLEKLVQMTDPSEHLDLAPERHPTMGKDDLTDDMGLRHVA